MSWGRVTKLNSCCFFLVSPVTRLDELCEQVMRTEIPGEKWRERDISRLLTNKIHTKLMVRNSMLISSYFIHLENKVTTWTGLVTEATITHLPPATLRGTYRPERHKCVCVCWAPSPSLSTTEDALKGFFSHPFLHATVHQNAQVI